MLNLFFKLTSGIPCLRKVPYIDDNSSMSNNYQYDSIILNQMPRPTDTPLSKYPVWIKRHRFRQPVAGTSPQAVQDCMDLGCLEEHMNESSHVDRLKNAMSRARPRARQLLFRVDYPRYHPSWEAQYSFYLWEPIRRRRSQLPLQEYAGLKPILRSYDRKVGLKDVTRESSRVQSFGIREALIYSYYNDMRFVTVLCAMIGFSIWWFTVPEPLLYHPDALASQDLKFLTSVVKDTYEYNVCSTHQILSPCECGEPLNRAAKSMFSDKAYTWDPLHQNKIQRVDALSIYLSSILITIMIEESISQYGTLAIIEESIEQYGTLLTA